MKNVAAFAAGLLFAVGLVISGMTQPANIVGFLDFFGAWKPALAWVMAGAVGIYAILYPFVRRRRAPLFAPVFDVSSKTRFDARLWIGAASFGVGWGLAGFCPGPAVVALGTGAPAALIFFGAMLVGIYLHHAAAGQAQGEDSCG